MTAGRWLRMNIIYFGGVLYNDIFMVSMNDNNGMKLLDLLLSLEAGQAQRRPAKGD
jgi:hypothetical protein